MIRFKAATAKVDLAALRHNVGVLCAKAPKSKVFAIVKANGYGHGSVEVAKTLLPIVNGFGVARIEEAHALINGGITTKPILLLEGFYSIVNLPTCSANNFHTAIHCKEQVEALENVDKLDRPLTVWIKIDTGMHRLGVRPEELDDSLNRLEACPNVKKPLNFMSHFGCGKSVLSVCDVCVGGRRV